MEGLMIDGFHGMSSAYFLGCIAENAPTSRVEVPAIAASEGESQVVSGFVWAMLLSCRTHMLHFVICDCCCSSFHRPAHPEDY